MKEEARNELSDGIVALEHMLYVFREDTRPSVQARLEKLRRLVEVYRDHVIPELREAKKRDEENARYIRGVNYDNTQLRHALSASDAALDGCRFNLSHAIAKLKDRVTALETCISDSRELMEGVNGPAYEAWIALGKAIGDELADKLPQTHPADDYMAAIESDAWEGARTAYRGAIAKLKDEVDRLRRLLPPDCERSGGGVSQGSWSVFAEKVVEERDALAARVAELEKGNWLTPDERTAVTKAADKLEWEASQLPPDTAKDYLAVVRPLRRMLDRHAPPGVVMPPLPPWGDCLTAMKARDSKWVAAIGHAGGSVIGNAGGA